MAAHCSGDPGSNLPIATDPAVLTAGKCRIVGRQCFEQLNIGGEADTDVGTFNQVVTEQRFGREAFADDLVKSGDIVDGFAVKHRLGEEFLVGVGNDERIRVGTLGIGKNLREARCAGTWKGDADSRLDNCVTAAADARCFVDLDAIDGVSNGFDQPHGRAGRELGVGIERDDVVDLGGNAAFDKDTVVAFTHEESIEVLDLSTLAFAADPGLFAFRPHPWTMKEDETPLTILAIEGGDPLFCGGQQLNIRFQFVLGCINEVREEPERKAVKPIGQETNFQFFDFAFDARHTGKHDRHDAESGGVHRNSLMEVQLG